MRQGGAADRVFLCSVGRNGPVMWMDHYHSLFTSAPEAAAALAARRVDTSTASTAAQCDGGTLAKLARAATKLGLAAMGGGVCEG